MIKIDGVTKKFEDTVAINDLSLEIAPGVTGLVGHNGAGKTTLLRLISDVYKANTGTITIDGMPNDSVTTKKNLFFLSDDPYYSRNQKIAEVFYFYETYYPMNRKRFARLIKKFELPIDRKVGNFSKGMKRQMFIALALSVKCKYLLMDEAFDGIDPITLEAIKDEIIKIAAKDEKTVVLSTHNVSIVERLCDKLVVITKGKLGSNEEMQDVGSNYYKYQCYFNGEVSQEALEGMGIKVIYFKKNGSLINFVSEGEVEEEKIRKSFDTVLFENVQIEGSEIIAIEMMAAKQKFNKKETEEDDDE